MTRPGWLAVAGCVGIAALGIALVAAFSGGRVDETDGVSIRGIGNSGNTLYAVPSARRLSRAMKADRDLPLVTDEELRRAVAAVKERAFAGDVDAANFIIELAAVQRVAVAAAAAPGPAPTAR